MTERAFILNLRSISKREIKNGNVELGHIIAAAADEIEQVQAERDQAIAQFEATAAAQGWQRTDEQAASWCPFCKTEHPGGDTCLGRYP